MYSILFTSVSLFAKNFLLPKSRDLIIKMMAIENCIQSIKIIECRLSKVSSKSDEKSRIKEVSSIDCPMTFTSKMKCHYLTRCGRRSSKLSRAQATHPTGPHTWRQPPRRPSNQASFSAPSGRALQDARWLLEQLTCSLKAREWISVSYLKASL